MSRFVAAKAPVSMRQFTALCVLFACTAQSHHAPPDDGVGLQPGDEPVTVLVVFDKSGSMADPWGDGTRYSKATEAMLGALSPHQHRVTVGAILFPNTSDCAAPDIEHPSQLDFMPAPRFIHEWMERASGNGPGGSTPLHEALAAADRAIERAGLLGLRDRRLEVMVLTDGQPTCGESAELLRSYTERWRASGIRTTVFGLPGSEVAQEVLDDLAEGAGSEGHAPVESSDELEDEFEALL